MDHQRPSDHADEIVSLNADDLRVEELERRLEMALALPADMTMSQAEAELDFTCGGFECGGMTSCSGMERCGTYNCPRLRT